MRRRFRFAIVALMTLAAMPLVAEEPPPAPEGFAWKKMDSVKASFLVPKGWYFKEEVHEGTRAFFITQEDIDAKGVFETGLTINVMKLEKTPAQVYAAAFIGRLAEEYAPRGAAWQTESGVLKGFGCRVRKAEKGSPPLIMHDMAIGNSRTNTLYLLFFESPEASWERAWSKGEQILKLFLLDDEY
jgi:hypothetical protein